MSAEKDRILRTGSGRRSRTRSATKQGRYVRSTPRRLRDDLALDATLRAAAPFQLARRQSRPSRLAVQIQSSDIREKIRERRVGNVILFVVDASGSMGAHRRMVETKAAIMSLLMDAYQKRDRVAMVVFRGREAELVLPPTSSVETAGRLLADLPVGGRTPLSAGLVCSADTIERIMRRDAAARPLVIVLTDGKANAALGTQPPHHEALAIAERMGGRFPQTRFIVIDTEAAGVVRLGLARKLSDMLGAHYFRPEELRAEELVRLAREG
jgi:magnesium chelatase subunit D